MALTRDSIKKLGITDEELITKLLNAHHAEVNPLREKAEQYDKVKADFDEQSKSIADLKASAGDQESLQKQIADLTRPAQEKAAAHQKAIEEMQSKLQGAEFDKLLDDAITKAGGRRKASIRAELKLDELKASKDRSNDIDAAIKALKESEDTSFLFGSDAKPSGARIDSSGRTDTRTDWNDAAMATARAVMGLKPTGKEN